MIEMFSGMQTSDWFIVFATVMGPVLAVQTQKFIERVTSAKDRKFYIFRTLLATRANRISPEHVIALNLIDVDFVSGWFSRSNKKVIEAWREYARLLDQRLDTEAQRQAWHARSEDLFVDLLSEMAKNLKVDITKERLRYGVYNPQGHVERENLQIRIQNGMLGVLSGDKAVKIRIDETPRNEELRQQELRLE